MMRIPTYVLLLAALVLTGCPSERDADQALPNPIEDDTRQLNEALERYNSDYLAWRRISYRITDENVGTCTPGTMTPGMQDTLLHVVNYYRKMARLDTLALNAEVSHRLQAAALMFQANNALSSTPPSTWSCFNPAADSAARNSRLAGVEKGTEAIDLWMRDAGAELTACPNRRWLLYTRATRVGLGGNDRYTLAWTADHFQDKQGLPTFIAWPPPGYIASPLVPSRWSFSIPGADFSTSTIQMSGPEGSPPVVLQKNFLNPNFGDATVTWDIANLPLPPPAGLIKYQVVINGVRKDGQTRNYGYVVSVFNPLR